MCSNEIAANAAELDRNPAFPHAAFAALKEAGALTPPPERADEWQRVRAVSKADGSVGRIFEGHLNALRAARRSRASTPRITCSASGAPIRAPDEGEPARIENGALHGSKVFCSGAGGLDRALVIAKGTLVYVDLHETRRGRQELVPRRRDAGERVAPGALPWRAGPGHAAAADDRSPTSPATRSAPRRAGRGCSTRRSRRQCTTWRASPASRTTSGRSRRATWSPRIETIDRWFERAANRRHGLDPAQARRSRRRRDDPRRGGAGRPAHARSRRARPLIARAATSSCSCCSTASTRSWPAWAASGSKPHAASCRGGW